ncbi:MAG TPA: PTS sugar transporter subunit IIA [bacterium]|nr:PTS sugar transporter subunit IIA [bacterium]HQO34744.1 PTS sugar transporter subunit IIA [bacterium]HQP97569.1 PTS sugar transporter subunit IIA [bacterium]
MGEGKSIEQDGNGQPIRGNSAASGDMLCDLLRPERVVLTIEATGKRKILEELLSLVVADQPEEVQMAALEALMQREEVGSTGVGDGIALPHARTAAIQEIRMAAGVSGDGLDFDSLDGKPVQLFFLILTPASASGAHLKLLGQLARVLRSRELREDLRSAATCQQFCQILRLACGQSPEHGS